ncbi:uncharacterized protein LOC144637397 isoform X1 [Oculina patagonica]
MRSEGCNDPGLSVGSCGIAYIIVNGKDHSHHGRGHNVVVVDAQTGAVLGSQSFDTFGDGSAGDSLRDYLNAINGNKIVLVATQDEASMYASSAFDALRRLGAKDPIQAAYRGSFAFVGYAQSNKPHWITQEQHERYKGPSEISLRIILQSRQSPPLGMESGEISNAQIRASSHMDVNHAAIQARLHFKQQGNKQGGWTSRTNDVNQWLLVDIGSYTTVTGIATQGRNSIRWSQWVTKFKLQYSVDGVIFQFYQEPAGNNSAKVFTGNQDSDTVVYNKLSPPITARYVRLRPVAWNNHISMRMELYGCQGCMEPIGMESGVISDAQITASSQQDEHQSPSGARLNNWGWTAGSDDLRQWLQVDMGSFTRVTRVSTQGVSRWETGSWVTRYALLYSDDGFTLHFYQEPSCPSAKVFTGNRDRGTVVYNRLSQPITARYIRIMPLQWHIHVSMRLEIYGCPGCIAPLGMESKSITDDQLRASSQLESNYSAVQARLHFKAVGNKAGGWSALSNNLYQWLQVDIGSYARVTRVATQGRNAYNEWVTKYRLQYSDDGVTFQFYKDVGDSSAKVFEGNHDSDTVVYNKLRQPIIARYIRVLPTHWNNRISMRIELFGCPDCIAPVGMESGSIFDTQISASSQQDDNLGPQRGRLNMKIIGIKQGGWAPLQSDLNQWLQVNLGSNFRVTRVATQGRDGYDQWVTKYRLQYRADGVTLKFYQELHESSAKVFDGNDDSDTVVYNILNPPFTARYIQIVPIEWHNYISMRVEIYGCKGIPSKTTIKTNVSNNVAGLGETVAIRCSSNGYPKPVCRIYREGVLIYVNGSVFLIRNFAVADQGKYTCNCSNAVGAEKVNVILLLYESPDIDSILPAYQLVNETDSFQIVCNATGNPPPVIKWEKVGDNSRVYYRSRDKTLRVKNAVKSDFGTYRCTAVSVRGENVSAAATVEMDNFSPVIDNGPRNITVLEQERRNVTLYCNATGKPTAELSWIRVRDGKTVAFGNTLLISAVDRSHRGEYRCIADNGVRKPVSKSAFLDVHYNPSSTRLTTDKVIPAVRGNGRIVLTCVTDANPPPSQYQFYRDGVHLRSSITGIHVIQKARHYDAGKYLCVPVNSIGTGANSSLQVYVTGAFSIIHFPQNITINESTSVSLFCNATAYPPDEYLTPHISWTKLGDNNKVLPPGEQLVLKNVSRHDKGTYMCKAENVIGFPDTAVAVLNVLRCSTCAHHTGFKEEK